jgi:2-polyprenyl-3-methyl-5-hydroxy-6-metoxy-1,4-benzoquinol methylase
MKLSGAVRSFLLNKMDPKKLKFAENIKKIVEFFQSQSALDYGSGGSNLNTIKFNDKEKFIDYVGLKKIYSYEPARNKIKKKKCDLVLCFDVLEHIFINDIPLGKRAAAL